MKRTRPESALPVGIKGARKKKGGKRPRNKDEADETPQIMPFVLFGSEIQAQYATLGNPVLGWEAFTATMPRNQIPRSPKGELKLVQTDYRSQSLIPQVDPRASVNQFSAIAIIHKAHSRDMFVPQLDVGLLEADHVLLDALLVLAHFPIALYPDLNPMDPNRLRFNRNNVMLFWELNAKASGDSRYYLDLREPNLLQSQQYMVFDATHAEDETFKAAQEMVARSKAMDRLGLMAMRYPHARHPLVHERMLELEQKTQVTFCNAEQLSDSSRRMLQRVFETTWNPIVVNWMSEQMLIYSISEWRLLYTTTVSNPEFIKGRGVVTDALVVTIERPHERDTVLFEHAIVSRLVQDRNHVGIRIQAMGSGGIIGSAICVTQHETDAPSKMDLPTSSHPPNALDPNWITTSRGVFGVRILVPRTSPLPRVDDETLRDNRLTIEYDVNYTGRDGMKWISSSVLSDSSLQKGSATRASVLMLWISKASGCAPRN